MGRNVEDWKNVVQVFLQHERTKFEHKAALKWVVHWSITATIRFLYLNFVYQAQVIIEP